MAELQRKSLCPRLIDYLAIVGVRQTTIQRNAGNGGNGGGNVTSSGPAVQVCKYIYDFKVK